MDASDETLTRLRPACSDAVPCDASEGAGGLANSPKRSPTPDSAMAPTANGGAIDGMFEDDVEEF